MSDYYSYNDPDSGLICAKQALALAEKLKFDRGIFWSIVSLNHSLFITGNYSLELDYAIRAFPIAEKLNDQYAIGWSNGMLCDSYLNLGDYNTGIKYVRIILKGMEKYFPDELYSGYANMVPVYVGLHQYDSALIFAKKGFELLKTNSALYNGNSLNSKYAKGHVYLFLGEAFEATADYDSALFYYRLSIPISDEINTKIFKIDASNGIAKVYHEKNNADSAAWYAKRVLDDHITQSYPSAKLKAANLLADIYERKKNTDSSLKYLRITVNLKDSLYNREKTTAFQNSLLKEQEKQKELASTKLKLQNEYRTYFLIAMFIVLAIVAGVIIKNRRIKQLQDIRNSIADDLHDDIGSALSSISIMSELAKEKSPEALPLLASIGENTSNMQENMSDIIWTIKAGNDRFENVLQRMNQFASEILDSKNIWLDFKADECPSASKLTVEQRKNFYLFFKEAINNAAKYSDAKKICVCVTQKNHVVEMNIHDNGKGFDTTKISPGNGMSTLTKRAAELNADFKIKSNIDQGTSVQLRFKIS
jgi:signal transduction histidine kinase